MRTSAPRLVVVLAATALALTACSGGPGGGELDYEDSPLNTYLSAAYGGDASPEEQQKKFDEQQKKQEELMAECMAEQGFEYKPNIQDSGAIFTSGDGDWDPENKEWVEKYGYGAVNSPWQERNAEQEPATYQDPNQKYIDSLSESEKTAYYETLYGPQPDPAEMSEDGSFEYKWENAGCQGKAQHEVQGDDPWQQDEFADLRTRMEEFWTSTQESSEMADLNAEWAACMTDAGEPGFTNQMDAAQSIYDEQSKIYEAAYGDGSEEMTAEQMEAADPSKSPEMKKLGEREIELALKDHECRQKTSYLQNSLKIQFALEEQFIKENKADLEAFKTAAEQAQAQ
ncbi:hypothetical protein [Microbacterium resistens]|uniref:hypothetical protein n=1 Tax=Microbacterium resistens TaxID=156977 RepID=UPI000832D97B|nr:hypothetical protein [Microbacterium resistens]